jgi:hypothetical protein
MRERNQKTSLADHSIVLIVIVLIVFVDNFKKLNCDVQFNINLARVIYNQTDACIRDSRDINNVF